MTIKTTLLSILLSINLISFAQIPAGYYDDAIGLREDAMKLALHNIIKGHTSISYKQIWTSCQTTDKKTNGKVWDMYSDIPSGTPPYEYTFVSDQCGNYSGEGSCYNREHSFPKSWFNNSPPMNTDIFHIYPTDGYVNGRRSNYPFGEVSSPTWSSQNGSKLGPNTTPGYTGTVFEPIDEYKGDFARTYFYMATRYYTEDGSWPGSPMVDGAEPKAWAMSMLYQWHMQDTVSQKEINRNNDVYGIQHNRNPFIDHPEWVDSIWFDDTSIENLMENIFVDVYPNPAVNNIEIRINSPKVYSWEMEIYNMQGRMISSTSFDKNNYNVNVSNLSSGIYFIKLQSTDNKLLKS